jgi:ribosomal protein S18 acetylase RimI-like enzyme
MTAVTIVRPATVGDAAGIARVHIESWRLAYRGLLPRSFLDDLSIEARTRFWEHGVAHPLPRAVTLVAVRAGQVAGFCSCGPSLDATLPDTTGEVAAIYVDPAVFRQGIGRALMDTALDHLAAQGFTEAVLWVLRDNAIGRGFYDAYGWRPDGTTRVETLGGTEVAELRYRRELAARGSDESR